MNCSDNAIRLGLKLVDKENKITNYDIDFIDNFKLKVFDIDENRNIKMEKIVFCFA